MSSTTKHDAGQNALDDAEAGAREPVQHADFGRFVEQSGQPRAEEGREHIGGQEADQEQDHGRDDRIGSFGEITFFSGA